MLPPEELTEGLDLYYSAVRQKQKSKSGLISHEQASQAVVANDIPREWAQGLKDLQSSLDLDLYELAGRLKDKDPLDPDDMEQAVELIDRQLANVIKEWLPYDPSFENTIIPVNFNGDSQQFWRLHDSLKKKGFL